jgi:hypothetical protein
VTTPVNVSSEAAIVASQERHRQTDVRRTGTTIGLRADAITAFEGRSIGIVSGMHAMKA